jgi:RimJ/RimL family protein N-acetyltransferase
MFVALLTERLSIEPLSLRDVSTFVAYRQEPEIARYQSWASDFSTDQGIELIRSQDGVDLPASGQWLQLAIHDRESGELLGDVALHRIDTNEQAFEIGFTLAGAHQGRGIAREAVRRLLEFLFFEVGALTVRASSDSRNAASISLLRAVGFQAQPEESWFEEFKGECVRVDVWELASTDFRT